MRPRQGKVSRGQGWEGYCRVVDRGRLSMKYKPHAVRRLSKYVSEPWSAWGSGREGRGCTLNPGELRLPSRLRALWMRIVRGAGVLTVDKENQTATL
jgi:hypothetical protein